MTLSGSRADDLCTSSRCRTGPSAEWHNEAQPRRIMSPAECMSFGTRERRQGVIDNWGHLDVIQQPQTAQLLDAYFDPQRRFAGDTFLSLGRRDGGDPNPDSFEVPDLLAITLLDVSVGPAAMRTLLHDDVFRNEVGSMLVNVPLDKDVWEVDLGPEGPAWQLCEVLDGRLYGVGEAIGTKLLARKRPRAIPIVDRVVHAFVPPDVHRSRWGTISAYLANPSVQVAVVGLAVALGGFVLRLVEFRRSIPNVQVSLIPVLHHHRGFQGEYQVLAENRGASDVGVTLWSLRPVDESEDIEVANTRVGNDPNSKPDAFTLSARHGDQWIVSPIALGPREGTVQIVARLHLGSGEAVDSNPVEVPMVVEGGEPEGPP
jgi:hypothetical protein